MKNLLLALALGLALTANAQEIRTLINPVGPDADEFTTNNTFTLPEGQAMRVLYGSGSANNLIWAERDSQNVLFVVPADLNKDSGGQSDYVIAGPAIVYTRTRFGQAGAFTVEIFPSQYPPGKSAVITERDGPMKCTLEESTDLVNWRQSASGQTHTLTNANEKKFFRLKLERDVGQ